MGALVVAGLAAIVILSFRQRTLAVQNERNMFAASVVGRAQMLEQFVGRRRTSRHALPADGDATDVVSGGPAAPSRAARRPGGMDSTSTRTIYASGNAAARTSSFSKRYQTTVSMAYPTVVRSPWARDESRRSAR